MRRGRQRPRGSRETAPAQVSQSQQPPTAKLFLRHGVDINTNMGEGFGPYRMPGESDVLPFVTSANIACGAHAGDPSLMEAALEECRYYGLALGAHIGYPDLQGFGRREIHLSTSELRASVLYQIGALSGMARTFGFELTQVRPHGFLYRQMSHDVRIATVVAKALAEFDRWLILIGPSGSNLLAAGERAGIRVAQEAWLDRAYDSNGNLLPHTHSRAQMRSQNEIMNQARLLINHGEVIAADGSRVKIDFQTIHLHAGMPQARAIAEELRYMIPNACALTSEPFTVDEEKDSPLPYLL
ncbi:MAG: LamB/YcsF family protein [Candidatus Obscuribacterales bacterium]|nr:LamB/YcsF family protein [Candidatus Obscuribacterales bacterium]